MGTFLQIKYIFRHLGFVPSCIGRIFCNIQMYIILEGVSGMDITAIAATMDDEADCELGDTDVGADFGDFGF